MLLGGAARKEVQHKTGEPVCQEGKRAGKVSSGRGHPPPPQSVTRCYHRPALGLGTGAGHWGWALTSVQASTSAAATMNAVASMEMDHSLTDGNVSGVGEAAGMHADVSDGGCFAGGHA
jgi:hypothetical protein